LADEKYGVANWNFEKLGMKIEATGKSTAAAVKLKRWPCQYNRAYK